jgi:hypothetical protein
LADDARFLEGLKDLDQGLGPESRQPPGTANRRAPTAPGGRPEGPADTGSIDSLDFLTEAIFEIDSTVAPVQAPPRPRPLLDRFPPAKVQRRKGPAAPPQKVPAPSAVVPVETRPPPPAPPYGAFYDLSETPFGL